MTQTLKDKKILVIVESPNKVRHIQDYLKKAGYNVKYLLWLLLGDIRS